MFFGRREDLKQLAACVDGIRSEGRGSFLVIRGRRQVGKSRLITEFLSRSQLPYIYYQATRKGAQRELSEFTEGIAASSMACAPSVRNGLRFANWGAAFSAIAGTASKSAPTVVVIDEFPYLAADDPDIEATIQKAWDHQLEQRPVLLILVGSDLAMMSALSSYERPLYGRIRRDLFVKPLNPAETAELQSLDAAAALDGHLVTGGFPRVALSWSKGKSLRNFISDAFSDPSSPLIVVGERMLAAEFPADAQARTVLAAIGDGNCTFTNIASVTGLGATSLQRSLELLQAKNVVVRERPFSVPKIQKNDRYRIGDPYLSFWLRFVEPSMGNIERGRGDISEQRMWAAWDSYRGRAIEPIVRESLLLLTPDTRLGGTTAFGGYWTRSNDVEIDLVGLESPEKAKRIELIGSIKWRQRELFSRSDVSALFASASSLPGTDAATHLVGVSRTGFSKEASALLHAVFDPEDLLQAWQMPRSRRSLSAP